MKKPTEGRNRPPQKYVPVQEKRLLAFATACFQKAGLDEPHASLISRLLVNSDLRGVRSHGSQTVNGYCSGFEQGHLNPRPNLQVVHETPATVVLDGDGTLGYLPMVRATELAIAKAKETGLGMGLARHIGHYGSAGHYTRQCMEQGCVGFSAQGYPGMGNASERTPKPSIGSFGNPPFCFAIPSGRELPLVLDGGTYILGQVQHSPEYVQELFERIPEAFYRSFGLAAISSVLGGTLAGIMLPEVTAKAKRWPGGTLGGMILAIHVDSVVPKQAFLAEVDRMIRDLRTTHEPMPGTDRALLPGAIDEERLQLYRREGIHYGEMEQASAREVSQRLGIPLPWDGA
ncbi:MAG: Ldh family oxidoreductase [Planctomycetes bacterium]|nr:Ldh family oxidoreductase [Planctomycetota bacterium]